MFVRVNVYISRCSTKQWTLANSFVMRAGRNKSFEAPLIATEKTICCCPNDNWCSSSSHFMEKKTWNIVCALFLISNFLQLQASFGLYFNTKVLPSYRPQSIILPLQTFRSIFSVRPQWRPQLRTLLFQGVCLYEVYVSRLWIWSWTSSLMHVWGFHSRFNYVFKSHRLFISAVASL